MALRARRSGRRRRPGRPRWLRRLRRRRLPGDDHGERGDRRRHRDEARREAEIRKARTWWTQAFWPQSADDILAVMRAFGSQENNWFRQVAGYWGMVASFLKNGVLNETLFLDPSFSGELFVIYAKVAPFLKELREESENPTLMANLESVILSEAAKPRLEQTMKNVEKLRKTRLQREASTVA